MKVVANSLPKAGTHLLVRVLELAQLHDNGMHFSASLVRGVPRNPLTRVTLARRNSVCDKGYWVDLDQLRCAKCAVIEAMLGNYSDGTYSQAHLPYSSELDIAFFRRHVKMLYIIRDPRDVVVSHFHHLYKDRRYPGHKLIRSLKTDRERLMASIMGIHVGEMSESAGIATRLRHTVGWLHSTTGNVLSIRFEDLVGARGGGADDRQYLTLQSIEAFLDLAPKTLTDKSTQVFHEGARTFRKGVIGGWREYFDETTKQAFKSEAGQYLIELGYEQSMDW